VQPLYCSGSRVRIPLRVRTFVSCAFCVGSDLSDWLITRAEESYRVSACECMGTGSSPAVKCGRACC